MNEQIELDEMLLKLQRLCDTPYVTGNDQRVKIEFKPNEKATGVITNPRAILELLDKFNMGLLESTQIEILDNLISMLMGCSNNVHALKHLMTQPLEYLKFSQNVR